MLRPPSYVNPTFGLGIREWTAMLTMLVLIRLSLLLPCAKWSPKGADTRKYPGSSIS